MSRPVPAGDYVAHFDPELDHHRAWLLAVLERLVAHEPRALEEGGSLRQLWGATPAEVLAVAAVAAATSVTYRSNAVDLALPLVQQFECCQFSAYPETGAEPWTVGWGSTSYADGTPMQAGDPISLEQADGLLAGRLERDGAWRAMRIPGWAALSCHQQAALLSFTYNCVPNWFGSNGFATLSRCLLQGEPEQVPAALLLLLCVSSGGPSEAGLRRRRKAEAALWCASPTSARPPSPGDGSSPSTLGAGGSRYRNPLRGVPRIQQRDAAQLSQCDRTCFSSSCAMRLEALKPERFRTPMATTSTWRWCSATEAPPTPTPSSRPSPTTASPPGWCKPPTSS
jgi:GH24 family phage-related lysozyme (muramidase)